MKIDERDEGLGSELDRVVRSVEPRDRVHEVIRRGSRRRAARWTAIGVLLTVFVGGVALAGLELRGGRDPDVNDAGRGWPVYEAPGGKWRLSLPPSWHVQLIAQDCEYRGYRGGVVVSSVPFDFHHPDKSVDGCDGRFVMAGFPREGVALAIEPVGTSLGIPVAEPDTAFPIGLSNLIPTGGIRGGPSEAYLMIVADRQPVYRLATWMGHDTTLLDHDTLLRIVQSIDFEGAPSWITYRDPSRGFSFDYPTNWFRSEPQAFPTFPFGGPPETKGLGVIASYRASTFGPNCGPFPSGIEDLGSVNALIMLSRISHATPYSRPDNFGPQSATLAIPRNTCPGAEFPFRSWTFEFTEGGRSFRIDVASGISDAGEVRNVVWRILNTLRFDPR